MAAGPFVRLLERQFAMATPGSFVPPRVSPSRPKRRFSLEQANKTLPLVSRIVGDIVRVHKDATGLQGQLERLANQSKNRPQVEKQLETSLERLHGLVDELSEVGCEMKDYQIGLVDFVGRHQSRDVYLCWKLGENKIGYWHELDAGFAGRQPVSTLDERE
jgi:hypothetical protein